MYAMIPIGHFAAAAKRRREQKEEEEMTQYKTSDLDGWEFKIVRSALGRFRNAEVIGKLISEEAQNGWEIVEKFDDYRIRFKRRIDKRTLYSGGNIDPYRTNYGIGNAVMPLIAVSVAVLLGLIMYLFDAKSKGDASVLPMIALGVIVLFVVVMIVVRRK